MSLRMVIGLGLIYTCLGLSSVAIAQDASNNPEGFSLLDGIRATQVYGPEVTPDAVRNKAVLFVYFRCEGIISRPMLMRLRGLQDRYYSTGRFMVLASEVMGDRGETRDVCRQSSISFPVFMELDLPQARETWDTPYAVLFDHEGTIIDEGDPNDVIPRVRGVIEDAPEPVSPLLEGVEITDSGLQRRAERLVPGTAIRSTVTALEREARQEREPDVAAQAQAMLDAVNRWIEGQLDQARGLMETSPAHALLILEQLQTTVRGMDANDDVEAMIDTLEDDRNVSDLAEILEDANTLSAGLWTEGMGSTSQRMAERLRDQIDSFLERDDLTDELAHEAQAIRSTITG
jgi:hypothetical protein